MTTGLSDPSTGFRHIASLLLLIAGAGLSACNPDAKDDEEESATVHADALQTGVDDDAGDTASDNSPEALEAAFSDAYGKAPPLWRTSDEGRFVVTPARLITADFATILVSTAEMPDGCHACAGALDIVYLKPANGGYAKVGAFEAAIGGSSFGKPPSLWKVSRKFSNNPVIYSEGGGTWQGYSCVYGALHELTSGGPDEIATFPLYFSDSGALGDGKATELKGEVANVEAGEGFDIVYTGTRRFTDHYIYKDGEYRLSGKSQMETC